MDAAAIVVYKGSPTDLQKTSTNRATEHGKAKLKNPMVWEENMDEQHHSLKLKGVSLEGTQPASLEDRNLRQHA